jgi:catalase-peroxidase
VSLADLIGLGGCAAVAQAATNAGHDVQVPFAPGRTDASQDQTDVQSFAVLEPKADGFRDYLAPGQTVPAEVLLVEKAQMLTLTAPEMTVLVGGMRALNAGRLDAGFFVKLLEIGKTPATTSRVDLVFGANSELRSLAEVYACDDAKEKFVRDFAAAWNKVMNLDRYDVRASAPQTFAAAAV